MVMVMTPMAVVMAEMAVAVTMTVAVTMAMAMTMTMAVTTTGESRGRNGEGCRRERESAEDGRDDLLHANHGGFLYLQRGDRPALLQP